MVVHMQYIFIIMVYFVIFIFKNFTSNLITHYQLFFDNQVEFTIENYLTKLSSIIFIFTNQIYRFIQFIVLIVNFSFYKLRVIHVNLLLLNLIFDLLIFFLSLIIILLLIIILQYVNSMIIILPVINFLILINSFKFRVHLLTFLFVVFHHSA